MPAELRDSLRDLLLVANTIGLWLLVGKALLT